MMRESHHGVYRVNDRLAVKSGKKREKTVRNGKLDGKCCFFAREVVSGKKREETVNRGEIWEGALRRERKFWEGDVVLPEIYRLPGLGVPDWGLGHEKAPSGGACGGS